MLLVHCGLGIDLSVGTLLPGSIVIGQRKFAVVHWACCIQMFCIPAILSPPVILSSSDPLLSRIVLVGDIAVLSA